MRLLFFAHFNSAGGAASLESIKGFWWTAGFEAVGCTCFKFIRNPS